MQSTSLKSTSLTKILMEKWQFFHTLYVLKMSLRRGVGGSKKAKTPLSNIKFDPNAKSLNFLAHLGLLSSTSCELINDMVRTTHFSLSSFFVPLQFLPPATQ